MPGQFVDAPAPSAAPPQQQPSQGQFIDAPAPSAAPSPPGGTAVKQPKFVDAPALSAPNVSKKPLASYNPPPGSWQAGLMFASPVEESDWSHAVTPQLRSALGAAVTDGYRLDLTSVAHGHHVADSAHYHGRAADIGMVNGVAIGDNVPTRNLLQRMLTLGSSRVQKIGTFGALANDPQMQALAHEYGVELFVDEGSGPHMHVQVGEEEPAQGAHPSMAALDPRAIVKHGAPVDKVRQGVQVQHFIAAKDPLAAVDAVLGVAQRMVAGTLTGDGNLMQKLGDGIYTAFHPHDEKVQDAVTNKLLTELHLDPNSKGAKRFAEVLGAQMLTDPLTIVPFVGELKWGGAGIKVLREAVEAGGPLGKALEPVLRGYESTVNSQLAKAGKWLLGRRPELDPKMDQRLKDVRLGIEQVAGRNDVPLRKADDALVDAHADEIRGAARQGKLELPSEHPIRQRLLREAYVDGTYSMRAQARRLGYQPTKEEFETAPTGRLDYDLQKDYLSLIKPKSRSVEDTEAFRSSGGTKGKRASNAFEHERSGTGDVNVDPVALLKNRLSLGRALVKQRGIDEKTAEFIAERHRRFVDGEGGVENGGAKGLDLSADDAQEKFKSYLDSLSYDPVRFHFSGADAAGPASMLDKAFTGARNLAKQSILGNPFPHSLRNVGMLTFLKGGPEAFFKGLYYAGRGTPEEDRLALTASGAEYTREAPGLAKVVPGLKQAVDFGQIVTNRMEKGYRKAILDQLDRTLGPSRTAEDEYAKAAIIRESIGDYRNVSRFVAALDALGGPFVAFRLGIVPEAAMKALLKRPTYVEAIARGQQDVNKEWRKHDQSQFEIGGPIDDAAKLATNPIQFLTSPATIGALSYGLKAVDPGAYPEDTGSMAAQLARSYLPGVGAAEGFANMPYGPSPGVSPMQAGIASLFGTYFRSKAAIRKAILRYERLVRKPPKNT